MNIEKPEIGSEFHLQDGREGKGLHFPRKGTLVFSGCAAISAVLEKVDGVERTLLPSYCCDSMIEPFRRAGIEVSFYDVHYDNCLSVRVDGDADLLLWCNYFGFVSEMPSFNGVIVEDITHSLLSRTQSHPGADYLVASVRKWLPVLCGGWCSVQAEGDEPPAEFTKKKAEAMGLKARYLQDPESMDKNDYLRMFSESNSWLGQNYDGLLIDRLSRSRVEAADVQSIRTTRRENAHVLYEILSSRVRFMFPEEEMDCPLFVPIIVPTGRDELRRRLIAEDVYCPIHWPHPDAGCESNLYGTELSLVCDQRYGPEDMEREAKAVLKCLEG